MTETRWKAQERRVGRLLWLKRTPSSGVATPDLEGRNLVVEVKDRARFPTWIEAALLQAQAKAGPERLGIVVLTGPRASRDIVCLDLKDWLAYHGGDR